MRIKTGVAEPEPIEPEIVKTGSIETGPHLTPKRPQSLQPRDYVWQGQRRSARLLSAIVPSAPPASKIITCSGFPCAANRCSSSFPPHQRLLHLHQPQPELPTPRYLQQQPPKIMAIHQKTNSADWRPPPIDLCLNMITPPIKCSPM